MCLVCPAIDKPSDRLHCMQAMADMYQCASCGRYGAEWVKVCPLCGASWSTSVAKSPADRSREKSVKLGDYVPNTKQRLFTGFRPWDRLTSGMYPGSVYLLGGNKGLGKSTLSLMIASNLQIPSLIVSAEEPIESISQRALRTGAYDVERRDRKVTLMHTSCSEDVHEAIDLQRPGIVIIDSMNKFMSRTSAIGGSFGSPSQMKFLVDGIIRRSRALDMVSIVIGQVTVAGKIAGPNMIQHDVDAVLLLAQDPKNLSLRRGRAIKNRWGPTDIWVTMAMTEKGLVDPAELDSPATLEGILRARSKDVEAEQEEEESYDDDDSYEDDENDDEAETES